MPTKLSFSEEFAGMRLAFNAYFASDICFVQQKFLQLRWSIHIYKTLHPWQSDGYRSNLNYDVHANLFITLY